MNVVGKDAAEGRNVMAALGSLECCETAPISHFGQLEEIKRSEFQEDEIDLC